MAVVIVGGAVANKAGNGGEAWVRLSWALGLRRLGFDVVLVEEISGASAAQRRWFSDVTARFGLADDACLIHDGGVATTGLALRELRARTSAAALLVNLSGHLTHPDVLGPATTRLFVDLDPGYTQLWAAAGDPGARLAGHDAFATVGANVGLPACDLPTAGVAWIPVLPPVLLDRWPSTASPRDGSFTTVASWRNPLGTIAHEGVTYGSKAHAFRDVAELPSRSGLRFSLALAIDEADTPDRVALERQGWTVQDASTVTGTPDSFARHIAESLAEFSVAQPIYAHARTGWFSDRTAHYLASGRAALVQDTGAAMPTGEGFLTFSTVAEAVDGARAIAADPVGHGRAARALAERHLDSDIVLGELLRRLDVAP